MKKIFMILSAILLIVVVISSCQDIPTMSGSVLSDPKGVVEPTSWGDEVDMSISIDKAVSSIIPIAIPDTIKIKLTFLGYDASNVTNDNFMVFEDSKAQGFSLYRVSETVKSVDIMIIMDVTGSMGNEIEGLKKSLNNFIDYLDKSGFDVRVGLVPFGDYAPASKTTTDQISFKPPWLDLTNLASANEYVKKLTTGYGGDTPENSFGAIMYAWNNASWRSGAQRILILLTDAPSHYKGDGSYTDFEPQYTKDEVLKALEGYATLYMVASTGDYYSEGETDFSAKDDPREIADKTGGFVIYQSGYEEVDLTKIGIAESIKSTFIIEFQSDSPEKEHRISVYYEGHDGEQGHAEITAEY